MLVTAGRPWAASDMGGSAARYGREDFLVAQSEPPKLFRTAKRANAATWRLASVALLVIAGGAGAFGYVQYDAAKTLRTQLATATAEANKSRAEASSLRSQLGAAQDRINSQGTKLSAAEQQSSTDQQALDQVQQQETAEKQQLAAAKQQADREQQELTATKRQVDDEKRQLTDAQTRLAAETRPDLPVRLLFFNAVRPGAKVAVLTNLSDAELDLTLDVQSPGSNAHVHKQLVLAARSTLRMGPAQGVPLTPGQVITLDNAKFRRIVQTVS
jgi:hypothetical protein